jgi:3-hydroxybutyryl-CoA dehydratase
VSGIDDPNRERTKPTSKVIPLEVGDSVSFSKTVGESDVYLFAGITGDLSPNHINEEIMSKTPFKHRVAHGVLSLGFASTTSTMMIERTGMTAVSYGYDRVRFIKPVLVGDTITATYTIAEIDEETLKTYADIKIVNQRGELCTVARNILKFIV